MTHSTSEHTSPPAGEAPAPPLVSAVVVAFDSPPDRLHRCVSALAASTGVQVEIVLVDNGSQVSAQHPLAAHTVRRTTNGGFAAGVNEGIGAAIGQWVAIVNDDAVVAPDMLARCVAAIAAAGEQCVAAAPKVHFPTGPQLAGAEPYIDSCGLVVRPSGEAFSAGAGQPDLGQFDGDATVLGPCMSAAVFRRDAFVRVGLLDERYFLYYEDVDWALRAFLSGHTTVFVPAATAVHEHAASTRAVGERRRYRMVQRNLLLCATVNLSARGALRAWAGRCVAHAKAAVKGPDRTSGIVALAGALRRTPSALAARRRRRAAAVLPDSDAFAFAAGLTPYVDATSYRPDGSAAAQQAAEARRARTQAAG